jgi:hypothetical protein
MSYSRLLVSNADSIQVDMFSGQGYALPLENGAWNATFVKRSSAYQVSAALF